MDSEGEPYIEDVLRKHLTLIALRRLEKKKRNIYLYIYISQWAPGAVSVCCLQTVQAGFSLPTELVA